MAIASYLTNYARYSARPPRGTSQARQPTTRAPRPSAPRVTGRVNQPTTNTRGQVVTPGQLLPAAPPAAAALPVSPPPPPDTPVTFANLAPSALPIDPTYDATEAALRRQRDDALLGLAAQRTQGLQDYGFTQAPTGAVNFDPSNPFSRAALLRKNYMEGKQSTQTSYAARGQLYAGALQTAQAANDSGFNQNENALERALLGFLANNQGSANRARSAYESGMAQAMADRVMRAQQDLANNPPVIPDGAAGPVPADAAPDPVGQAAAAGFRPGMSIRQLLAAGAPIPVQTKTVGGRKFYLGASGRWIPL